MSNAPELPNHIVIPFLPGEPLTYPVCGYHLGRINDTPSILHQIDYNDLEEMQAIDEAVECETFSTMYKETNHPCVLCESYNRDLHAC